MPSHPPVSSTEPRIARTLERVSTAGHLLGRTGKRIDVFPTGMTRESGAFLTELVQRERAARTIETGFALGLSTLYLLDGRAGSATTPIHTAIDPFAFTDWDGAGARLIAEAGVERLVRLIIEDSAIALPRLIAAAETFDLGFVDGGHLFDNVFVDVLCMMRLVRPGGLIVVDDLWMPAIRCAARFFTTNCGLIDESVTDTKAARRFAVLRNPATPLRRAWNHFVPFA